MNADWVAYLAGAAAFLTAATTFFTLRTLATRMVVGASRRAISVQTQITFADGRVETTEETDPQVVGRVVDELRHAHG